MNHSAAKSHAHSNDDVDGAHHDSRVVEPLADAVGEREKEGEGGGREEGGSDRASDAMRGQTLT